MRGGAGARCLHTLPWAEPGVAAARRAGADDWHDDEVGVGAIVERDGERAREGRVARGRGRDEGDDVPRRGALVHYLEGGEGGREGGTTESDRA